MAWEERWPSTALLLRRPELVIRADEVALPLVPQLHRSLQSLPVWLLSAVSLVPGPLAAQEFGAAAQVERPLAARQREDPTAAGTAVQLANRRIPLESLRDVAREVPGALPLSGGGYGSFSSLSLRG